jgi:hypothetical protein
LAVWEAFLQTVPATTVSNRNPVANDYVSKPRHLPLVFA